MGKEKVMRIEELKVTRLTVELVGDSDLILHKKSRAYEREQVWVQSHVKGSAVPQEYKSTENVWEKLITSITWENTITFHDDNCDLYTEDEWKEYMNTNRPCILAPAFYKSFSEAFKTFGFKESTKKAGTDFQRALTLEKSKFPVTFAAVTPEQKLVPNGGINNQNVICCENVFSGWSCTIQLVVPDVVFPYETVLAVIQCAGKYIGIGTQRKYGFGRYHIEKVMTSK